MGWAEDTSFYVLTSPKNSMSWVSAVWGYNGSVCSGSVVVTAYDFESGHLGLNPELYYYTIRLRSLHRAYPSFHPFGVVHWAPEQLNIKAVTSACKLIDGCSLELCSATPSVASSGIFHRNKVNSIAWLYRDSLALRSVTFTFFLHLHI